MVSSIDFRSDPSDSPEGKGKARAAWDAYARAVNKLSEPVLGPVTEKVARSIATKQVIELVGFWTTWHLYGGFEGLVEHVGMHPSTVWKKVKKFRIVFHEHPDTYQIPGITIDYQAFWDAMRSQAQGPPELEG